jgi:hypothetical protein
VDNQGQSDVAAVFFRSDQRGALQNETSHFEYRRLSYDFGIYNYNASVVVG